MTSSLSGRFFWQLHFSSQSPCSQFIGGKNDRTLFTGWFWYVGMLVPVIGLVQVGEQARADRYTYLPQIGLYVVIAWGIPDLILSITRRERNRSRGYALLCAATSAMIVILLSWRAFVQTSYWKNSEVLWNHALAVTGDNDVAHNNLGNLFLQRRELDSARSHFETALKIRARTAAPYYNFGGALIENSLAAILAQRGLINESISHHQKAISMRPDYGDPYLNLGNLLFQQGRIDDAMAQWEKALRTQPHDAAFHALLGDAFLRAGSQKVAIAEYSVQRRFPRRTRWAVTIWPGSSRPLLMLQFAMEIGQSSSRKRLSDSPAAKIPITSEPLPLRSPKLAISVRPKKLLGRLCKQPRGGATPLWPTRFGMKSHFMSSACRITSKARVSVPRAVISQPPSLRKPTSRCPGISIFAGLDKFYRGKQRCRTATAHSEKQNGRARYEPGRCEL